MASDLSKKQKVARACDNCRRKKTRCDGVFPNKCSNCKHNCTYNDTEPKKMYKVSYVEELEARLAQCQALLDNSSISYNTDDSLKRKHSITPSDNSKTTDVIPSTDYCDLNDEELARNINGLYIPSDDVRTGNRNFGKASMRGLFERITFYTGMASDALTQQRRYDFWVEDWEKELSSNSYSHNTDYTDEDFGSDEVLYHLVNVYFRMVNVTLPLLNETRFKANIPSRKLEKEFGSVLLMVCALGAIFSGNKSFVIAEKEHLQFLAGFDYYKIARKKMKDFSLTPATLEDVQALILLQVYADQGVHTKSSWIIHGMSILLARNMGLQHSLLNKHKEPLEAEASKRALWIAYIIDRSHSSCFGKPLLLKDEDIYLELPQPYGNEDEHGSMGVFYMSEMIKLCKIHGQVMQKVYKYRKSIDGDDHVLTMTDIASLHSKLHSWLDQMPDFLHICKDDNETDFIMQLRSNLRLAYYTIQIFMYKPFLPNPTLRNPSNFQFTSLLICANASRSIIGNCKEVVLKRNLNKIYVDSMMDWGPFWATLILIIRCCESRRLTGHVDEDDVCYVKSGILVLRVNERKNVQYGRAIDVLLQVLKAVKLPNCEDFIRTEEYISYQSTNEVRHNCLSNRTLSAVKSEDANQQVLAEQDYQLFGDMLEYMQNTDAMKDNLFSVDNLNFMSDAPNNLVNDSNFDWSKIISPLLDSNTESGTDNDGIAVGIDDKYSHQF